MIRPNKVDSTDKPELKPFTPVSPEVLEERRALLDETAGCWSAEVADRIAAELREFFRRPERR
jgi:hypothetical protein